MADVSIIDVDLGASVESIIGDDLTKITADNRADILAAIAESRQLTDAKQAKQQAERSQQEAVTAALDLLIAADQENNTVAARDLLLAAQPAITTMNSLVQRLKALLKTKKMPCQLANLKHEGETYYYLQGPETAQESADASQDSP